MQIRTVSQEVDTLPWPQHSQARKPTLEPNIRRHESVIPPLFDLAEHDDCYVLAIDLPGLPNPGSTVELKQGEIQVGAPFGMGLDPLTTNILFRCRSLGEKVRAVYHEGVLWVLLPKTERVQDMGSAHGFPQTTLLEPAEEAYAV